MAELKYLFEAHLSDGTVIQQTPQDVSRIEPGRSAFYDVQQRIADIKYFGLFSENATYLVDLTDGHFEIDGKPFHVRDPQMPVQEGTIYRLIYFRRHQVHFNLGLEEIGHDIQFFLGWQTTIDGKNYQQTIVVE